MRIFVVGGAGYIGSVCAELLLDEGHEVAIFDNLTEGHGLAVDSRANFIQGELADREQIQAALSNARPDAVMHFAANALVAESMRDPSARFSDCLSGCQSRKRLRRVRSIHTANRNSLSKKSCTGTIGSMD